MDHCRREHAAAHNPKYCHECQDQLVVELPLPTIRGGRGLLIYWQCCNFISGTLPTNFARFSELRYEYLQLTCKQLGLKSEV